MKDFGTYFIPEGRGEIEMFYGPPNSELARAAAIDLPHTIDGKKTLQCHPKAAPALTKFFDELERQDLLRCIRHIGPCYENSFVGFPPSPSLHTNGAALTLNLPANNENSAPPAQQPAGIDRADLPGGLFWPKHPIVLLAKSLGFAWGGDDQVFPRPAEFTVGVL